MDLVKAILALGGLKDKLTYEQVIRVKETLLQMDDCFGELAILCDDLDMGDSDNLLQSIAKYDDLKNEIIGRLE